MYMYYVVECQHICSTGKMNQGILKTCTQDTCTQDTCIQDTCIQEVLYELLYNIIHEISNFYVFKLRQHTY